MRYMWECSRCEVVIEIQRSMNDCRDEPKVTDEGWPEDSDCQHDWIKSIQAPRVLRATYLDGQRSSSRSEEGRIFRDIKQASELKVKRASMRKDSDDFKEATREIKRLERIDK